MSSTLTATRPFFAATAATAAHRMSALPATDDASETVALASTTSAITTASQISARASTTAVTSTLRPGDRVRKMLFGPVDHKEHEANRQFVQQELADISTEAMRKWNFDFNDYKPLEGKLKWDPVASSDIPQAYNMVQLNTPANSSSQQCLPESSLKLSAIGFYSNPAGIVIPKSVMSSNSTIMPTAISTKKSRAMPPSSSAKARRNLSFTDIVNSKNEENTFNNNNCTDVRIIAGIDTACHKNASDKNVNIVDSIALLKKHNVNEDVIPTTRIKRIEDKTPTLQMTITDYYPAQKRTLKREESAVSPACSPDAAAAAASLEPSTSSSSSSSSFQSLEEREPIAKKARND